MEILDAVVYIADRITKFTHPTEIEIYQTVSEMSSRLFNRVSQIFNFKTKSRKKRRDHPAKSSNNNSALSNTKCRRGITHYKRMPQQKDLFLHFCTR